ncbi:MAG: type IV pilus secretin PilQ [Acidobacteriia bacterium]|nr:type IV pilus secretin PilQ [Terriglobia bacterium]
MRAQHGHIKFFFTLLVGLVIGLNLMTAPAWSGEVNAGPPSVTTSNSARPLVVQGVNIRPEGGKLIIDVRTNGNPTYKSFELENPQRVVVDVANAVLETEQHHFPVDQANIRSVRLAQFSSTAPQTVRAVITFRSKVPYVFSRDGNSIRMVVDKGDKAAETALKTPPPAPAAKTDKPSTPPAVARVEKASTPPERKSVQIAPPKPPVAIKTESGPLVASLKPTEVALPKASAPAKVTDPTAGRITVVEKQKTDVKPLAAAGSPGDTKQAEAVAGTPAKEKVQAPPPREPTKKPAENPAGNAAPAAALVKTASDNAPISVAAVQTPSPVPPAQNVAASQQAPAPPRPTAAPVPQAASNAPIGSAAATSDIISLDLRDVDIRDFFRLIHEVSGLNVILDPSVRGTLTIALKDVPWEQALRIVLLNNQLTSKLEGNVLRIVTLKGAEEENIAERKMKEAQVAMLQVQVEPRRVYTRIPNYMKADDLKKVFEQLLGKGTDLVYTDKDTNTVLVRTTQTRMDDLDAVMKKMDIKKQQVEIEARVVTANRSFLRDLGVQLGAQIFSTGANGTPRNILTGSPISALNSPNVRQPRPPVSSSPPATTLGQPVLGPLPLNINLGAAAATSSLGYVFNGANALIDAFITASESKGLAKLLSKPKIITRNHEEGEVNQGTKIPIQTVVNSTVSTVYINAVLDLTVTPHITEEGTIFLDVKVTRDTPDFNQSVGGIPTIQTQFLQTKVLLIDGGTVVVGGVLIDDNEYNIRQVPGLGSLPIIGNAFRNKSVTQSTQELLFFLTPKIIQ